MLQPSIFSPLQISQHVNPFNFPKILKNAIFQNIYFFVYCHISVSNLIFPKPRLFQFFMIFSKYDFSFFSKFVKICSKHDFCPIFQNILEFCKNTQFSRFFSKSAKIAYFPKIDVFSKLAHFSKIEVHFPIFLNKSYNCFCCFQRKNK